ncbi:TPA: type II secretion system protein GspC [Klebsiella michiganensis]|uniref:type II secretion system protein GspC n=1 Tax=Klebsiella michiganensis TaxID=1134687 RepID=UPI00288CBD12|nr:type II secretion system protein GspC [Klebsiella michiganensis]ELT1807773.1 type II secretion system protein GspC [Klebsiella michiganensis]MDV0340090.1 type II secretion system protein GspC [Klebsiella michiganensis]MDV0353816.1 type II secretion system protein GspC [Klebsiella michiganensis]MDV0403789.1 type II secretion system protein GspC [Klebsiella michiganensis]HDX8788891.1 type II secretion system protein GspC [Klebsiella michiganensis]
MHNSVMRLTISNKKIINYAPHIVTSIILFFICQQLAQLTWKIILPVNFTDNALSPADMTAPAARSPETALPRFTLFGLAEKTSASAHGGNLDQAPVSALKLRVTGLLASTAPSRAIAIMMKGNQQVSLGIGDNTPGGEAKIVAIFPDRLIVNYRGRNEAIPLFNDPPAAGKNSAAPPARQLAQELRAQPQNILHYLNISPVMVNDKLSGYRLNPGKDPALFRQAGLKENDLAIALNGLDLRDKEQSRQALAQLPELTEITLTVERDGQKQDIYLALRDE